MITNLLANEVGKFTAHYQKALLHGLKSVSAKAIEQAAHFLQGVLNDEGTLYIFGNGGSYALARHFEAILKEEFRNSSTRLRTNCGIDPCAVQSSSQNSFTDFFVNVLKTEKANAQDMVLLISGSGDSDNLIRAARYARRRGVPTISVSGFGGGKIAGNKTDLVITVPINDQQIVEDVMQPLLRLVAQSTATLAGGKRHDVHRKLRACVNELSKSLTAVSGSFVLSLASAVSQAFFDDRGVYVLAPEGGRLALSAEHTAHNFNWDAVYRIKRPPQRRIYSTLTGCDFSGISNDRLMAGIAQVQQLDKARPDDLLLLFVHDPTAGPVRNALRKANQQEMKIFLASGTSLESQATVTPDLMQMIGHMTARVVRLCVRQKLGEKINEDIATTLIKQDMAQRRLLKTRAGT